MMKVPTVGSSATIPSKPAVSCVTKMMERSLQGYFAQKKHPPRKTLQ
jgi:hypothetical protein